jgi:hypothetical protein
MATKHPRKSAPANGWIYLVDLVVLFFVFLYLLRSYLVGELLDLLILYVVCLCAARGLIAFLYDFSMPFPKDRE